STNSERESQARADQAVAAEDDRYPGGRRTSGQRPEPLVRDPLVEEQVRREAVLGTGSERLVGPDLVRDQDAAVDQRGVSQLGEDGTEIARSIVEPLLVGAGRPAGDEAEHRARSPLIRRGGPQPPLLDERTDAGGYGPLEPAKAPRGHPTGDEKLGMRVVR